ncbi:PREDICTED: pyridoxine-5'-phosphate oxidase-like isoform X1 [Priapulus caudatus]|uniref:pyridoxal 5'-phosphate synthase n=1 Tax=Priapulus caudatus TaxID=37621 RepID=A0ABM1E132_PRICU|nr:PREDICTED: pyridoxine-5'-phosphate oxidase-like isoform X1 [Priapulus caudatus]
MRIPYKSANETFTEDQIEIKDPFALFEKWFRTATECDAILEPNAMFLATSSRYSIPSVRPMLLKGFCEKGFVFYSNYQSRKGKDLEANPNAAVTFYWEPLRRCVRIEGIVEKISREDTSAYFHSRPHDSQVAAICSLQSKPVASFQDLRTQYEDLERKYPEGGSVPLPATWGGYRLVPDRCEFWQGQSSRLHDRILFLRGNSVKEFDYSKLSQGENSWCYCRLFP